VTALRLVPGGTAARCPEPRALATAVGLIDDLLKAAPERTAGQRGAARVRLCEAGVALK